MAKTKTRRTPEQLRLEVERKISAMNLRQQFTDFVANPTDAQFEAFAGYAEEYYQRFSSLVESDRAKAVTAVEAV